MSPGAMHPIFAQAREHADTITEFVETLGIDYSIAAPALILSASVQMASCAENRKALDDGLDILCLMLRFFAHTALDTPEPFPYKKFGEEIPH